MRSSTGILFTLFILGIFTSFAAAWWVDEYKSGIIWPEPTVMDAGLPGGPPADAVVLFDGKSLDGWEGGDKWKVEGGVATAAGGSITSKQKFGDCQLHVEFATPEMVVGEGQGRGNSGVYFMGQYEVQILDSHGNQTYFDGQCGSTAWPASKCVAAVEARCPPAEKPKIPTRRGDTPNFSAFARTNRIAR